MKSHRPRSGVLLASAIIAGAAFLTAGCTERPVIASQRSETMPDTSATKPAVVTETATFGAGCFWCVEAVLQQVDGVVEVKSGFMGGALQNPSYEDVCTGTTGHAEVVQIKFDPKKISYEDLLAWFWKLHDPTTLNRQGADEGTQYRSAIFYYSEAQRQAAVKAKEAENKSGHFSSPIVTEITAAGPFYSAEAYHQEYYERNKSKGYCRIVIAPKLEKLGLKK